MIGFSQEHMIMMKTADSEWRNMPVFKKTYELTWITDEYDWQGMTDPTDTQQVGSSYGDEVEDSEKRKLVEDDMMQTLYRDTMRDFENIYGVDEIAIQIKWIETPRWLSKDEISGFNISDKAEWGQHAKGAVVGKIEVTVAARVPTNDRLEQEVAASLNGAEHTSITGFQ